jgi:hypothetical protein
MKLSSFKTFLQESVLVEGGNAVKVALPIEQDKIKEALPALLSKLAFALNIEQEDLEVLGSAGKKPSGETSGDIDIGVRLPSVAQANGVEPDEALKLIDAVAHRFAKNGVKDHPIDKLYKPMRSLDVYSFGYKIGDQYAQIDLMPVSSLKYASWAYHAAPEDMNKGLKGAHRNELLYAVAKFAGQNVTHQDESGPVEVERHFFDLSKGLLRGKQTRVGLSGKVGKNWRTVGEKPVVTNNPDKIAKELFGKKYKAKDLMTFDDVWGAIHDDDFPHKEHREKIISMARDGVKNKKLKMPKKLEEKEE